MNFKIFGKQVKVGETFSKYAEANLLGSVQKYFANLFNLWVRNLEVSKKWY